MSGLTGAAIEALRRALELDPQRSRVKVNLAGLLHGTGRSEEALELLRAAAAELPDDPDVRARLEMVEAAAAQGR
jgi:thioredoxin-like negative regulator of GroEL